MAGATTTRRMEGRFYSKQFCSGVYAETGDLRDSVAVWIQKPESEPSTFEITLFWGEEVPESFRSALEKAAGRWEKAIRDTLPAVDVSTILDQDVCGYHSRELPGLFRERIEQGVRIYVYMSDTFSDGTGVSAVGGQCLNRGLPYPTTVLGKTTGNPDQFDSGLDPERLRYVAHHEIGRALGLVGGVQGTQPEWFDVKNELYRGHLALFGHFIEYRTGYLPITCRSGALAGIIRR